MELELRKINIQDIVFGPNIEVVDGVLYINKDEIINMLMEDERILEKEKSLQL